MEDWISRLLHHCHGDVSSKWVNLTYNIGKEAEKWKKRNKMILSMKYLVFKEQLAKKFVDQYVSSYIIDKVVSTNAIKLWLLTSKRIYLVVNVSQVV